MGSSLPRAFGPYALLQSLGQGAMGDVHLARPFNPRRGVPTPIVIKRLHGELGSDEDFIRRFKHEAQIAVSVDSEYVAKVYDVGSVGPALYIAMEHVFGWPLSKFLDRVIESARHASIGSVIDMVIGALTGLEALHTAVDPLTQRPLGTVHRDISPKNLMVGQDGQMRLIDLGLGKSNLQDWKTRTGVVMGSVGYMPPEQIAAKEVDHRADLYAIGVVFWEMLALRNYIKRTAMPIMLKASMDPPWAPPSKYRSDVPKALDALIQRAVAKNPDDRFPSARAFITAIREVVPEHRTHGLTVSLIKELFGPELEGRKQNLERLLQLPLPYADDEEEAQETTVVFVEAPGVRPLTEEDLAPTKVESDDPPIAAPRVPSVAHPYTGLPMLVSPTGQPLPGVDPAQVSASPMMPSFAPVRQGISLGAAVLLMFGAVALTIFIDRVVLRDPPASPPPVVEVVVPAPTEIARPMAQPVAPPPSAEPPAAEDVAEEAPAATERPRRTARRRDPAPSEAAARPGPEPAAPEGPTAQSVASRAKQLFGRAEALKSRLGAGDPRLKQIDSIRSRASMAQASTDYAKAEQQLEQLAGDLAAIE